MNYFELLVYFIIVGIPIVYWIAKYKWMVFITSFLNSFLLMMLLDDVVMAFILAFISQTFYYWLSKYETT